MTVLRDRRRRAGWLVVAALLVPLAGCGETPLPQPQPASADVVVPVVSGEQIDRVLVPVTEAVEAADAALDVGALAGTVGGPAKEQREGAYLMKKKVPDSSYVLPLGAERLQDLVPADQGWPRTVLTVTRATPEDQFPDLMLLTQAGPRDPFVLTAYAPMLPGATLPLTQPLRDGVPVLPVDEPGDLLMSPADAAARYADVLTKGPASKSAAIFADDPFRAQVVAVQEKERKALTVTCKKCFTYTATHAVRDGQVWAFGTQDGGALVMSVMSGTNKLAVDARGSKADLNAEYAALADDKTATKAASFGYVEVVALYVPPAAAEGQVQVLAAQRVPVAGTAS